MEKLGFVLGILTIIIGVPLVTIWALNTLFTLTIPYNVSTWFAVLWLSGILAGSKVSKKS